MMPKTLSSAARAGLVGLILAGLAGPVVAALVPLSEDPAYATYYNGARRVNDAFYRPAHSPPHMVECYGVSGGYPDVGAFWTFAASRVAGETWTFSGWIGNYSSAQMPVNSYGILEIVFKTADGTLIPFETRLDETKLLPDRWTAASVTALEPVGATEVSFFVKLLRNDIAENGGLYFDTLTVVSPVPEPWATGLLALAVIAAGTGASHLRRRRSRLSPSG